tara:strand:+ start:933 stop:2066 length:1134 start_codon:yes stop_codon:yes gene_type:complete
MPSFKPKKEKKQNTEDISVTLDDKHQQFVDTFKDNNINVIPTLKQERKNLKILLKKEKNIDTRLEISDKIAKITDDIKNLIKFEKNYYLNNSNTVFDYFESKKNIHLDNDKKSNKLNSFFKISSSSSNNNDEEYNKINQNLVTKYLSSLDNKYIDINNFTISTNTCNFCNCGELIYVEDDGVLICNNCYTSTPYLIDNDKPSFKEPPKEICFYAYKRINHFREILAQFQAKESTQIPDKVIDDLKKQIKRERLELSQITNAKTKEMLKKLGYNKYYEHIPFIKDIIGIKPPIMSPELEETLCNLFLEIQEPYSKFCPDERVNFLNYYYTIYKLCELLDQKHFLPFFPMLKDREKRIEQDTIWKKICNELNWQFIPTM